MSDTPREDADGAADNGFILAPHTWTDVLPIEETFGRAAPLDVDVGCGKGRFLLARAAANPDRDFLGIDRLMARLRKTGKKLRRQGSTNVRLLRLEASYAVRYLLPASSVSTFYVFFPDPWPKRRHHRRRLFTAEFLAALHERLCPDGVVHLATDHLPYFEEVSTLFRDDEQFAPAPVFAPANEERTEFEVIFVAQEAPIARGSWRKIGQ